MNLTQRHKYLGRYRSEDKVKGKMMGRGHGDDCRDGLKCRLLLQEVQQVVQWVVAGEGDGGVRLGKGQEGYQQLDGMVKQLMKMLRGFTNTQQKNQLVIKLLSALSKIGSLQLLANIGLSQVQSSLRWFLVNIQHMLFPKQQSITNQQQQENNTNKLSTSINRHQQQLKQNQSITTRRLPVSPRPLSLHLTQRHQPPSDKNPPKSVHQPPKPCLKFSLQHKTPQHPNNQQLKTATHLITMLRPDRILIYLSLKQSGKASYLDQMMEVQGFIKVLQELLGCLKHKLVMGKVEVMLPEGEWGGYRRNLGYLEVYVDGFGGGRNPTATQPNNQITQLTQQIYELIQQSRLQSPPLQRTPQRYNSTTRTARNLCHKRTNIYTSDNQNNKFREKSSSNSMSMKSRNSKFFGDGQEDRVGARGEVKGMNYRRVVPLRESVVGYRSSVSSNPSKQVGFSQRGARFESFRGWASGSKEPDDKGGSASKNYLEMKNNRTIQRRSGFVGLNRKDSMRRISTRWNNTLQNNPNLATMLAQSSFKKLQQSTLNKKPCKSPFALASRRRQQPNSSLAQQSSSSSSSHQTYKSRLKRKPSNESTISYVGQTYNFLHGASLPKLASKHTSLTLSSRNLNVIDERLQEVRRKLFYCRLMMLLGEGVGVVMGKGKMGKNGNTAKGEGEKRRKTFYEEVREVEVNTKRIQVINSTKQPINHNSNTSFKKSTTPNQPSQPQIQPKKFTPKQQAYFSRQQLKLTSTMDKYLTKKQQTFQHNIKTLVTTKNITQMTTQTLQQKISSTQNQLILKPFVLFVDMAMDNAFGNLCDGKRREKVQLVVAENLKLVEKAKGNSVGAGSQKCTELSLKYDLESDNVLMLKKISTNENFNQDDKDSQHSQTQTNKLHLNQPAAQNQRQQSHMIHSHNTQSQLCNSTNPWEQSLPKSSTVANIPSQKKPIFIVQPHCSIIKTPIKLLEIPITVTLKNPQFNSHYIYENIDIMVTLTIDQTNKNQRKEQLKGQTNREMARRRSLMKKKRKSLVSCKAELPSSASQDFGYKSDKDSNDTPQSQEQEIDDKDYSDQEFDSQQFDSDDLEDQEERQSEYQRMAEETPKPNPNPSQSSSSGSSASKSHQTSRSSSDFTFTQPPLPAPHPRKLNRTLSIDSSPHNPIQPQPLNQARIRCRSRKPQIIKHHEQKLQRFYNGYFSLEESLESLITSNFLVESAEVGSKLARKITETQFKAPFSDSQGNNSKVTFEKATSKIVRYVYVPNTSIVFKRILQVLPRGINQLEEVINCNLNDLPAKGTKKQFQFIRLKLQLKVAQDRQQKISQKQLIRRKYNTQTLNKVLSKVNESSLAVGKHYKKHSIIKKINTYFFLSENFTVVNKKEDGQFSRKGISLILTQEIYCQNFHQLYEREISVLNDVLDLVNAFGYTMKETKSSSQMPHNCNEQAAQSQQVLQTPATIQFFLQKRFKTHFMTKPSTSLKSTSQQPYNLNYKRNLHFDQNLHHSDKQQDPNYERNIYSIVVEEIPDNYSKMQYSDVRFSQYFNEDQEYGQGNGSTTSHHLYYPKRLKLAEMMNQSEGNLNGNISSFNIEARDKKIGLEQLKQSKLRSRNDRGLCSSSKITPLQKQRTKRTTIQLNKIQQLGQLGTCLPQVQSTHFHIQQQPKSKKNIAFAAEASPVQSNLSQLNFPSQSINITAFQVTQKQLQCQTQKSLKSQQSKSRLHRHGHHISSLMPTSSKVVKSIKNIESSIMSKRQKRKMLCPLINVSLNCYNQQSTKKRRTNLKSMMVYDSFIDVGRSQPQSDETTDQRQPRGKQTKHLASRVQQHNSTTKGCICDKRNARWFRVVIKRFRKYLLCVVGWHVIDEEKVEVKILTGLYEKNLGGLKLVEGIMDARFFDYVMGSLGMLEMYINCQLEQSFEINCNRSIRQGQLPQHTRAIPPYHPTTIPLSPSNPPPPTLPISKLIKSRLIARFLKILKPPSTLQKPSLSSRRQQHRYGIVSMFLLQDMPNEEVYIHLYTPMNGKNFVFAVQGSVVYGFLGKVIGDRGKGERSGMMEDSVKSSRQKSTKQMLQQVRRRRKPKLSIFSPAHHTNAINSAPIHQPNHQPPTTQQLNDTESHTNPYLKSINTLNSIKKKPSSIWSASNQSQFMTRGKIKFSQPRDRQVERQEMDWKEVIDGLVKVKRRVRLGEFVNVRVCEDGYVMEICLEREREKSKEQVRSEKDRGDKQRQSQCSSINANVIAIRSKQTLTKHLYYTSTFLTPTPNTPHLLPIPSHPLAINYLHNPSQNPSIDTYLTLVPRSIELVSLEYEEKKFALLGSFSYESFSRVGFRQEFVNFDEKLEHVWKWRFQLQGLVGGDGGAGRQGGSGWKAIERGNVITKAKDQWARSKEDTNQYQSPNPKPSHTKPHPKNLPPKPKPTSQLYTPTLPIPTLPLEPSPFSKTLPDFTTSLIVSMLNQGVIDYTCKKSLMPFCKKSILYAQLLNQFRDKCENKGFETVSKLYQKRKRERFYLTESRFCAKDRVGMQNGKRDQYVEGFIKVTVKRKACLINQSRLFFVGKSQMTDEQPQICINIQSISGEAICDLSPKKLIELFPYARKFSSVQLKRFVKRIIKEDNLVDYLKEKTQGREQVVQNKL